MDDTLNQDKGRWARRFTVPFLLKRLKVTAETILDQYVHSMRREHAGHVKDLKDESEFFRSDAVPSSVSPKTTVGLRRGGTMHKRGSIPMEVWFADVELRPNVRSQDRATDLLRRYPQFQIR
jgi:hypothetical protein